MKTKNIFRMLLVAVALLLGANNAMAYTLTYKYTIEWQNETVYKTYQLNEGDPIVPEDTPTMEGYSFSGWGYIPETMPNYDLNVTGNFSAINYAITANATVNGSFNVNQSAKFGSEVTIYINPNNGYEIDEVTVTAADGSTVEVTTDYKFIMPAQNVTVTVTFKAKTFTLTWAIQGESEPYLTQQLATGEAIVEPDPAPAKVGYLFNGWGQHEQTMPAQDYTITGSFTAINYTIAITPSEHGSLSAYRETAHYGDEITIYPQAENGYELDVESVSVVDADNHPVDVSSDLKFTMPASNVTISGTFVSIAPSEKARLNMSYNPSSVELTLGEEFTAPTLSIKDAQGNDVTGLTITYSSSNEGLATVANDGTVTLVEGATGSTTITASFAGDETYEAASAQYTITVKKPKRQITLGENEHTIWDGTPEPTHPGEWNLFIDNNRNWVDDTNDNSKIRIYVDNQVENDWKLWMGTYSWGNASWANWSNNGEVKNNTEGTTPYHADGMYFEYEFSEYTKAAIANGLAISFWGQEIVMVTHITVPEEHTLYSITIADNIEHGTITASKTSNIGAEEKITLTVEPATGYELATLTVKDASNQNVEVSEDYTFTMPASNVTVSATFILSYSVPEGAESHNLTFETQDYCAATWDSNTNTFTWGNRDGWNKEWTFMAAQNISGDLSNWTHLHLQVSNWTNASAKELKVVFKSGTDNSGPTKEIMVYPNASGNIDIDLPPYGEWGNVNGFDITKIFDLTIYGCARDVESQAASVVVTNAYYVTAAASETYTVSASMEHGTINITPTTYVEDADVTFTITPDEGYSLNAESVSITRTDNSESVNFTVEDGNYTFTMPASDVVISATFTINSHDVIYYVDGEEKYRDTYTYGAEISVREKWADTDDTHYSDWTYSGGEIPATMPDYDVELYSYSTGFAKVEITSSTGYTSFSSVRPLDFSQVEGMTAYIVVDADLDGLTASLKEVTGEIAANTGLILKGSVGEYEIPTATSSGTSYSNNMLVAVSSATTFGNDAGCFLLVERNGQALFAEANTGISKTVPANHAYLYVANASRAQGRYLSFIGDDLTGIGNIEVELTGNEVIYNLNGQRVEKPGKGLYIINGKKMVLK